MSTGLPRNDSVQLNKKIYDCNIILLHKYLDSDVKICDNAGMGSRGNRDDGVHLSKQGNSIFASNIKSSILEALGELSDDKSYNPPLIGKAPPPQTVRKQTISTAF